MRKQILLFVLIISIIFAFGQTVIQNAISTSEYVRKGNSVYYHDTLFTGTAIKKADNGQIIVEEHYENGIANGLWKEWYATGKKKFEGKFVDGKNDGEWIQWYEDGTVQRKINFENGMPKDK